MKLRALIPVFFQRERGEAGNSIGMLIASVATLACKPGCALQVATGMMKSKFIMPDQYRNIYDDPMSDLHKSKSLVWGLLVAFCMVWFYGLGARTLVPTDEGRYVEMAREM